MPPSRPATSYRLLSILLLPLWLLHALWQAIKNRQPSYLWQRLGLFSGRSQPRSIWIHAASVGEVELIRPLVERLSPEHRITITTFTATGYQHALRVLDKKTTIRALPIDLLPISRHFIRRNRFKLALIAETELWPETLYQACRQGIPLIQVNARLSARSLNASAWSRALLKTTLSYFDSILTRTQQDVENLTTLGADSKKITVAGNLKYAQPAEIDPYDRLISRPYILFASSHNPEELLFASILKIIDLKQLIVIAPRHPQRANEILKVVKPLGLAIQQRSKGEEIHPDTQIYLADTLGELKAFMAHAELVVMGGSFADVGGHNVLEPARLGCPIITGPSDDNIQPDIALLKQHGAIIQVSDDRELSEKLEFFLNNSEPREQLSRNALAVMDAQSHILQQYLDVIESYL